MKVGTENKVKTGLAAVLLVVAVVMVVRAFRGGDDSSSTPPPTTPRAATIAGSTARSANVSKVRKPGVTLLAQTLDPTLRFDLLKASEDVTYNGTGRDIFRSQAEDAAIPKPLPPDKQPQVAQAPPPPPPIDLKFYGFSGPKNGTKSIFLLKGEDIFVAREGDIVDRRYRILRIGPSSVDVEDVLTNNHQTLPLLAG